MTQKEKKHSSKEIKAAIALNYKRAAFLFNDKEKLNTLLEHLDEYIAKNTTIIDTFDDLKKHISIIRDTSEEDCTVVSPECIVSILSILLYLVDTNINSSETIENAIDRKALLSHVDKHFKKSLKEYDAWKEWSKPGIYPILPLCVIDTKEERSMKALTKRYEKLIAPTIPSKALSKAKSFIPENILNQVEKITESITEQELYSQVMNYIASGFDILVKNAAKVSLKEDYVVEQVNRTLDENHIFTLDQVCYARSYDIAKLVNRFKTRNICIAFAEGGITGVAGLLGIAANLAASMFIYYRAIQSIAMYYGYDVKNSAEELQIATDVFMQALSPTTGSSSEAGEMIVKFMSMTEALVVRDTIKGGWQAMAKRGGVCLLITQIRSLAHKSAQKALESAGKKGLEKTLFTGFLEQLGKKMTQKAVAKAATPAAAVITAFTDMSTMNKVIEFADIFYNKRFVTEKQIRIDSLACPEIIKDVDYELVNEEYAD